MVDNPTKIYNDYVRANLPNSMSYDTGTDRYDINSHSFFKFKNSNWYFNYISKYGYSALTAYAVNGFEPALVFDFKGNYFRKSATDSTFPASITHAATTNATMTDGYGPDVVTNGDFASDSGWAKGTGWTISGGVATHSGGTDGNLNNTGYTVSVPSNKTVTITYTISGHTAGSVRVGLAGGNAQFLTFRAANGTYTESVTNTGGNLYVRFQTSGFLGSIDNVSVREAPALKWRPHNILTHSGDLNNAGWTNSNLTIATGQNDFEGNPTAFKMTPTAVSGTHVIFKQTALTNLVNGILTTVTIDLKADGYNFFSVGSENNRYAIINLSDGTVSLNTGSVSPTVTSLGNGWYRCSITTSANLQEVFSVVETPQAVNYGASTFTGDGTSGVLVAYPHSFRSDLGGMVNNPDRGDSYVPTTTAAVYLSRRGHHIYNGDAWVNEGILHESEARTNQMIYSSNLAGPSGWTGGALAGTVTAGSPFGTYQTLSPQSSNASLGPAQRYQIGKTLTSGATYVGWALVKYSVGSGWFAINMYNTGPKANEQAYFDLQNGVVGSKQPLIIDHGMVDYGDGWWLCWASSDSSTNSGGLSLEVLNGDGVQSCSATDVILIAGSQFELGATPSSYIPTAGATVTRAAETLTVPAANLPYDSTNMSIQMDGKMTYADTGSTAEVQPYRWRIQFTPALLYSVLSTSGSRTGQLFFAQRETSVYDDVSGAINAYSPNTDVPFNLAGRYGSTFINGAHEGTLLTANTTPTALPDLSSADLELGQTFMGTIGEFRMWSDDLGDVGITEATLPSTEPSLSLTFDGSETSFIVLDWSE